MMEGFCEPSEAPTADAKHERSCTIRCLALEGIYLDTAAYCSSIFCYDRTEGILPLTLHEQSR